MSVCISADFAAKQVKSQQSSAKWEEEGMCPPYLFVSAFPALVLRFSPDFKKFGNAKSKTIYFGD